MQELFADSQVSVSIDESSTDSPGSHMEENFAPSSLAMNLKLKLDSAPVMYVFVSLAFCLLKNR